MEHHSKFQIRKYNDTQIQLGNPPASGDILSNDDALSFAAAIVLASGANGGAVVERIRQLKAEAAERDQEARRTAAEGPGRPEKSAWKEDGGGAPTSQETPGAKESVRPRSFESPQAKLERGKAELERRKAAQAAEEEEKRALAELAEVEAELARLDAASAGETGPTPT